jgi:transcriptional regulator of arginine metabolism
MRHHPASGQHLVMSDTIDKTRRHRAILRILGATPIASQDELAIELEAESIHVTQSTLSRDLKELRVTRVSTGETYRYLPAVGNGNGGASRSLPQPERLRQLAAIEVTGIDANEVVVAIHTMSGRAQGIAAYLDGQNLPDVLATVAGDDTVMVHPRRTRQTSKLRRRLTELFGLD